MFDWHEWVKNNNSLFMFCTVFKHALHDNSGLQYDVKQGVKAGMHLLGCFFDILLGTFY